jgi:DNA-directed RNA polymerase
MQSKTHLVRSIKTETRDDLLSSDLTQVMKAVNAIQATRWAINVPVLDVLQEVTKDNTCLAGLPQMDDEPEPELPHWLTPDFGSNNMTDQQKSEFKEWKQRARAVYAQNATLKSKRLALMTKLRIAGELRDEEAIYFPHSMDFRGRVYSMTAELQPQGDDIAKGLIRFADGKPLGESGGYWLAVHIANLFGVDKVSFDDRVQWTLDNTDKLMDSAMSPLDGQRFWAEADDPWCALAACFEWTGYQIEGDDYVSHLPIAMDGSCSGIQHFSAMLKDSQGGKAVNLTKTDTPSDIYTQVLYVTKDLLMENSEPLSLVWNDLLTPTVGRKIVKRPCMTFAYSVTSVGIRDQIADEMRKRTDGQFVAGHENWEAAKHLAPFVEAAIRLVVRRAAEAMDWLKEVSKAYSGQQIPVTWVTPLGFPVVQPYRKQVGEMLYLWFDGERIRLRLSYDGTKLDSRKHGSSVAPNFVHSMDATHLMMVVNRLKDEGVTDSVAVIHDSFGVHACDTDDMHYAIRDEFIKLYSTDQLSRIYQSTLQALPDDKWAELPTPPEAGSLDLEEVRDAEFFFA